GPGAPGARQWGGPMTRRPQLTARASAGHGADRRPDHDQGRGADGRAPDVLPVAHLDDRWARRLLDALPSLRRGSAARCAEGDRRGEEGARARQGLSPGPRGQFATAGRVAAMRVTKANVRRACAVCERTLLQGEYALRFSPDGIEFVDVCPLCQDIALEYGWVREGGPMSP